MMDEEEYGDLMHAGGSDEYEQHQSQMQQMKAKFKFKIGSSAGQGTVSTKYYPFKRSARSLCANSESYLERV